MSYRIHSHSGMITRVSNGVTFAADDRLPEYAGYLAWLTLGGTPEIDHTELSTPPPPISARQIRLALNQTGLRDTVEAAVAAGSRDLKDWWEYSTEVHRDNPLVIGMIAALGLPPEQADALWVLGAGL